MLPSQRDRLNFFQLDQGKSLSNILSIVDAGGGRRGMTYAFDYAYCVHSEIPTHYLQNSERIDKSRSSLTGDWITRVAKISKEVIEHAKIPGKIDGIIDYVVDQKNAGFIKGDDGQQYFWMLQGIAEFDRTKAVITGSRVRFFPAKIQDSNHALAIEIL